MDKSSILREIERSEYNCEDFFNNYLGAQVGEEELTGGGLQNEEDEDIAKKVELLKVEVGQLKDCINSKINEETEKFKEKLIRIKSEIHVLNRKLHDVNMISNEKKKNGNITYEERKKEKICNMSNDIGGKVLQKKNVLETSSDADILGKDNTVEGNRHECSSLHELSDDWRYRKTEHHAKRDIICSDKNEEDVNFERLLKRSIETKENLENVKKGLIFLKIFPSVQKEINELLVAGKNIKLDGDDKMKNALTLYNHLVYIKEHEEIISHLKGYYSFGEVTLYTSNFFDNFFFLLNDILCAYIVDNANVDITKVVEIYVSVFDSFWKCKGIHVYTKDYLIDEGLTKNIVDFLVDTYFIKTFFKFVQSENDTSIYNGIINYYEYYTAFIEERKEKMEFVIKQIVYTVNNANGKKKKKRYSCNRIGIEPSERLDDDFADRTKQGNPYGSDSSLGDDNRCENSQGGDTCIHTERFFVRLFKESIRVVCIHAENSYNGEKHSTDESAVQGRRKSFVYRIMDSLSVSVNILANSPFFISKKNILQKVLEESTIINKEIMNTYIITITDISHFDMECFNEVSKKVSNFDRHNLLTENKLYLFFIELNNDIRNIIEKKRYEINNNNIFHLCFFRFVVFFSYIYNHDTQFLLLFINIYNFLYEIIYNIKEEIKRKKEENDSKKKKKKKNSIILDESIQIKEEFNTSNMVIDYIKNVITSFIKVLNIFNNIIISKYEEFASFLFERTYYHFRSTSIYNSISKYYLQKEKKYPSPVNTNVAHIHNYFFHGDFQNRRSNARDFNSTHGNSEEDASETGKTNISLYENDANLSQPQEGEPGMAIVVEGTAATEGMIVTERATATAGMIVTERATATAGMVTTERTTATEGTATNAEVTPASGTTEASTESEECGRHLLKASLSKLNEIRSTISNNIIYFALVPLYDYLDKYMFKIETFKRDDVHKEAYDPQENICLLVETVFSYVEIFYEHKNEHLLQQLFVNLSEKYITHINSMKMLRKNILLQIQADVNYFIHVCKKFKIKNYKNFLLLYHSVSFILASQNVESPTHEAMHAPTPDIASSAQSYLNDHVQKEETLPFCVTSDDIAKAASHATNLLSNYSHN
ncbi:conserved Plasmodium protein, unknown function [Plasmodium ovale]|uniref:Uncharacterized protein n=2 Tax=Plasmodium ovale TaxID=36330 RepID=A0A1A8VX20_PLAOA|nr:conserved Plasmodium protein, unknown function [Plasmodium ovale curtisi]SBS94750.1 conserved Plasmodium protein, unknown function [Plasmodium ovale curtisi]SCQ16124.1 conserved Plasmodium protein, unknown function [Plasmodium ovale]